jgi:peroxiredoxin
MSQFQTVLLFLLATGMGLSMPPANSGELKALRGTLVAGDFAARDLRGEPVRFGELRGKVVLLNFWATWCPPCRKEMPAMEQLHQGYKDRGLVVIALSQDQASSREVQSFVEALKLSFPVWHDRDGLVGRQYSIPGVPTSYLIGADSRIAYRALGEYDWSGPEARRAVEQLLGERRKS